MSGKCPKCLKGASYVNGEATSIKIGMKSYYGVAYKCPSCSTILSVQMDPLVMASVTADEVKKALRT